MCYRRLLNDRGSEVSARNLDAVSFTSARAQAFLKRSSTLAASCSFVCSRKLCASLNNCSLRRVLFSRFPVFCCLGRAWKRKDEGCSLSDDGLDPYGSVKKLCDNVS